MSLSEVIVPHLPFLRRYARALTGTQESGDTYVAAVLESLIANPALISTSKNHPKVTLYHILSKLWGSLKVNLGADTGANTWESRAHAKLAVIPGLPRQVFLLKTLEGFNDGDIARILSKNEADIADAFDEATAQISQMMSGSVMIIEDEPLIALDLEDIVSSLGHSCTGVARTHSEAVKLAAKKKPDLVLSDIQLADGSSGIDAVSDILKSYEVPVIFITAFPERLLTGEKPEPTFLITKPFSPDMVKAMIAQALFFNSGPSA
ncbi:response regulator [Aestuariivirga litoralis]|uniref:response regulator n=1 Tax=Aestuariivirga litoralis TaxID=2650924 RepID=UPI0018C61DDB|nr:response regulator [Aestuariivirga litoralis]MBG1232417.1 response regulator [Aestuariivirga litoralis]